MYLLSSLFNTAKNLVSKTGSALSSAFGTSTVGRLGATIANAVPRTAPSNAQIFPIGQGLTEKQTIQAEKKVGVASPQTQTSAYIQQGLPLSQQPAFNQPTTRNESTVGTTQVQQNQAVAQQDMNTFISSGGAGTYQLPDYSKMDLSQYSKEDQAKMTSWVPQYDENGILSNPMNPESFGTLGGSSGTSGYYQIPGGAGPLPGSLTYTTGRSTGAGGLLGDNFYNDEDDTKPIVIKFKGSPDLFRADTGARLTQEEAGRLGAFQPGGFREVDAVRPGVKSEADFAKFNAQNLSPDELAQLKPVEVDNSDEMIDDGKPNDILAKIMEQMTALAQGGEQNKKDIQAKLDQANNEVQNATAEMKALELLKVDEIQNIVHNPNFSQRLSARRMAYLDNPQHPYWIQRLTLANELQLAEQKKSNILETLKLTQDTDRETWNRNLALFNTLKPDSLGLKTDAEGTLWEVYRDPLTGKIGKTKVMGGFEKQKAYEDYSITEVNGRKVMIMVGKDGAITQKDLGAITEKSSGNGLTMYQTLGYFNSITDNARQDPAIKNFAQNSSTLDSALKAPANSGGDIILMRALAKVSDPTSSVREEEFRTFQGAQGELQRYYNIPKQWLGKGQLSATGRAQIKSLLQQQYTSRKTEYDDAYNYYLGQVKKAGGSDADFMPRVGTTAETKTITINGQPATYVKGADGQWHLQK